MPLFVNATEWFFGTENCSTKPYLIRNGYVECFEKESECCDSYFGGHISENVCMDSRIISCNTTSETLDVMNYAIQIFGITFIVIILTGCIYLSVRVISNPIGKKTTYEEIA